MSPRFATVLCGISVAVILAPVSFAATLHDPSFMVFEPPAPISAPDHAEDMASLTLVDYDRTQDLPQASAAAKAMALHDPNFGDPFARGGLVSAPVPAGGILLLTALAGFGLLKRRRRTC